MDKTLTAERNKVQNPEDATLKGGEPSSIQKEPTPKETTRTYNQEEVNRLLQLDRMELGRERKVIESERDHFKSQTQIAEAKLSDIQEELGSLEKRIEELSSSDPELNNLEKRAKQVREQERQTKVKLHEIEAKEAELTESKNEITTWKRDQLVYAVADEFVTADGKNVDFDSFKSSADKFNLNEKEGLVALAETMGLKLKIESTIPSRRPYSGVTSGGTGFIRDSDNPDETLKQGFRNVKMRR